jgi:hypothetical protein
VNHAWATDGREGADARVRFRGKLEEKQTKICGQKSYTRGNKALSNVKTVWGSTRTGSERNAVVLLCAIQTMEGATHGEFVVLTEAELARARTKRRREKKKILFLLGFDGFDREYTIGRSRSAHSVGVALHRLVFAEVFSCVFDWHEGFRCT